MSTNRCRERNGKCTWVVSQHLPALSRKAGAGWHGQIKEAKMGFDESIGRSQGNFLLIIIFFFSPSFLFLFHHRVFQILCWIPFLVIRWRNL